MHIILIVIGLLNIAPGLFIDDATGNLIFGYGCLLQGYASKIWDDVEEIKKKLNA